MSTRSEEMGSQIFAIWAPAQGEVAPIQPVRNLHKYKLIVDIA